MERKDTEMMETEESSATTMQNNNTSSSTEQNDVAVRDFLTLARQLIDQGKPSQALPIVEKLHSAHPDDPAITRLLARLYSRNQQYDQAVTLYAALVAASPRDSPDPTLLDDNADALIRLKRFAEAETLLKRAVANPTAFPAKDDLGNAASHLAFAASANCENSTGFRT